MLRPDRKWMMEIKKNGMNWVIGNGWNDLKGNPVIRIGGKSDGWRSNPEYKLFDSVGMEVQR